MICDTSIDPFTVDANAIIINNMKKKTRRRRKILKKKRIYSQLRT